MVNDPRNEFATSFFHSTALSALAIAQPLYSLLSDNPAFFIAHESRPIDMVLMIAVLSVLIPICLVLIEAGARQLGRPLWRLIHSVIVIALTAIFVLPIFSNLTPYPGVVLLIMAITTGSCFCYALWRIQGLITWTSYLSVTVLIFPLLFVFQPSNRAILFAPQNHLTLPKIESTAPVVVLILDELPIASLMDADMAIDRIRYPNFAQLADSAWWFRDATTVSDDTVIGAVPAIVTGIYPENPSVYRQSPQSLFTLLGGSYDLIVHESSTDICPEMLCPKKDSLHDRFGLLMSDLYVVYAHVILPMDMRQGLPDISHSWKNFRAQALSVEERQQARTRRLDEYWESRVTSVNAFIDAIGASTRPQLHFLHVVLPHLPWVYLPNGARYEFDAKGLFGVPGVNGNERWGNDNWLVEQGYQRHLLQVGFVDSIIGRLINKLRSEGLYDKALIVVTSDHGVSFRTNDARRPITELNLAEITRVPLFIKAPRQQVGQISDRNVETVDILPTIAQLLDIEIPWQVDGVPAINPQTAERTHRVVYQQNRMSKAIRNYVPEQVFIQRNDIHRKKFELFGSGGNDDKLYLIGPNKQLIGRAVSTLNASPSDQLAPILSLKPVVGSSDGPWAVTGKLTVNGEPMQTLDLAIAVDSRVCSVTRSFVNSSEEALFVAFLGPSCQFRDNSLLEVFAVSDSAESLEISQLIRR
jgi:hypothetical protein